MFLAAFVLIIITIVIPWLIYHFKKYEDVCKLPGPPAYITLFEILKGNKTSEDVFRDLVNLNPTYGPVTKVWINPFRPTLLVTDEKYIQLLLTSNVHLDKSKLYDFLTPYIGFGLASCPASMWKKQRKLLNPVFHTKILQQYLTVFERSGDNLVETLNQTNGNIIDVFPILNEFTMSIICETFLKSTSTMVHDNEYFKARTSFYNIAIGRIMSLIKQYDVLYKLTKTFKKQEQSVNILRKFSKEILRAYRKERETMMVDDYTEKMELLDVLFTDSSLTEEEMLNQIDTFIIAGHDTSASVMSFLFFEVARHGEVQDKLLEEINLILGENKTTEVSLTQINQLKYMEATIKEVMRLYSPVPFIERRLKEDIVMDGTRIPAGVDISICAYNLHRNGELHPEPEKFDPERFMPENVDKIQPFAYVPFSAGPRVCIGKTYAMIEMKSTLAKILRHFELIPGGNDSRLEVTTEFVLKPLNGVEIQFKERC